jgi:hypothetical protein
MIPKTIPGRFSDRELLFGAAIAQLCMRSWPVLIRERAESQNTLFQISSGGGKALVLFKYSTAAKSPWHFTVTTAQYGLLAEPDLVCPQERRYMALICYLEGVCLLSNDEFLTIATPSEDANLTVSRPPGGRFRVGGPGRRELASPIPRSRWTKEILMR